MELITEAQLTPQEQEFWKKACQAVDAKNYGYAISLLKALVKKLPGFLEARKVLRASEIKLNPTPKKKGLLGGFRMTTSVKRDPVSTLSSVEDELEKDPFNEASNELLFHAAEQAGLPDIAAFALETVREGHPENKKLLHMLANHYIDRKMPAEAAAVYHDIVKVDPSDTVAVKGEKDCTAQASMQKQNWENAKSMKDVMKSTQESAALEKVDKQGMTRQEMEARLGQLGQLYEANPQDLHVVRSIANVYEQMEDWNNAYSFYSYAFTLSNNDVSLSTKASEMSEKAREAQLDDLKKRAAADPDNKELQDQLAAVTRQIAEEIVQECQKRVENNPTDPQLRFELGQALFKAGNFTDAIPQLQRARNNPYYRIKAMLMLGKCYEAKNMNDMALHQLGEANSELQTMDATKLEILYLMGILNEKLGKKQEALDCFKTIYDSNYGYRDVAQRVESAYN